MECLLFILFPCLNPLDFPGKLQLGSAASSLHSVRFLPCGGTGVDRTADRVSVFNFGIAVNLRFFVLGARKIIEN